MTSENQKKYYVPPHGRHPLAEIGGNGPSFETPKRVIFVGDSTVRLFGLIPNNSIRIMMYKGKNASAKGLTQKENSFRNSISQMIGSRTNKSARWVFCFGNADVNLAYYSQMFGSKEGLIDLKGIAADYVDFVSSLPFEKLSNVTIVGLYPSPLRDEDVPGSLRLYKYKSIDMARLLESNELLLRNRQERIQLFNSALKERCKMRGLEYSDLFEAMINRKTMQIRDQYRTVSPCSLMVVWETTLLLWLDKWEWLRQLAPPSLQNTMERSLKEYLKTQS